MRERREKDKKERTYKGTDMKEISSGAKDTLSTGLNQSLMIYAEGDSPFLFFI